MAGVGVLRNLHGRGGGGGPALLAGLLFVPNRFALGQTGKILISMTIPHFPVHGGGGEIRTHDTLSGITAFKTVALNRSATPPPCTGLRFSNSLRSCKSGTRAGSFDPCPPQAGLCHPSAPLASFSAAAPLRRTAVCSSDLTSETNREQDRHLTIRSNPP